MDIRISMISRFELHREKREVQKGLSHIQSSEISLEEQQSFDRPSSMLHHNEDIARRNVANLKFQFNCTFGGL